MLFIYQRSVYFQDTDAAGVVYFAQVLAMCHEAYEASLAQSGINLKTFFSGAEGVIPITHASVDFFQPLFCGDRLAISLIPVQLKLSEFEIAYRVLRDEQLVAQAVTRHVGINAVTRTRQDLSVNMVHWLEQWSQDQ